MKTRFLIAMAALCSMSMLAQNEYLPITVAVQDIVEPYPATAKVQLTNKLNRMLVDQGIASLNNNGQFVLTAFMIPQDKDVLAGPPMQIIETMSANLYIADVVQQTVLATMEQPVKGLGKDETRAYMDAIKHLNTTSPKVAEFIQTGKAKIIDYYNNESPRIIKEAKVLSEMHEYEKALYMVTAIPAQCRFYDEALKLSLDIFHAYQDYACQKLLAQAKMAWAAEQNKVGAEKAGQFLGQIYPDAACYGDAMGLYKEIKDKVLEDWHFEMKIYQDQVDLEKQRIEAARQVGIAYGNHQQPVTTYMGWMR